MNIFKAALVLVIILANFIFVQPTLAGGAKYTKNPEYIQITQALNTLKTNPDPQNSAKTEQKIHELELQKYLLESGLNWGQCRNETGKNLAVYGPSPDSDQYRQNYDNALYFLADSTTTKNSWNCQGVYLASDGKTTIIGADGQAQELVGPAAIAFSTGTKVIIKTNAETGAIEFNLPPTKAIKSGEAKWFIPNVPQAMIDGRVANAPIAKS